MTTPQPLHLLAQERRNSILEILERDGRATVGELVKSFRVSAVTVRADLDALAAIGALQRSHGGAVKQTAGPIDYPITFKQAQHHGEKQRIARAAADLIRPEQTIILDSGSTTAEIAREIRTRKLKLTVITNALNVALELCHAPQVAIVMLGGLMRPSSLCMAGPQAEHAVQSLRADHLFLGIDAIHPDIGLCTPDILEAQLNALMMRVSNEVTAVADFSKFQRRSLSLIAEVQALDRLITDDKADRAAIAEIRARGVEVMLV
jgi:DeoR family transcriptional regulator, aga operon transcriptional repressor